MWPGSCSSPPATLKIEPDVQQLPQLCRGQADSVTRCKASALYFEVPAAAAAAAALL